MKEKYFLIKQMLREFSNTRHNLQELQKEALHHETKKAKTHRTLSKVTNRQSHKIIKYYQNRFLNTLLQCNVQRGQRAENNYGYFNQVTSSQHKKATKKQNGKRKTKEPTCATKIRWYQWEKGYFDL